MSYSHELYTHVMVAEVIPEYLSISEYRTIINQGSHYQQYQQIHQDNDDNK